MTAGETGLRCETRSARDGYVLRVLSVEEMELFEDHIGGCAGCQEELEALGAIVQKFAHWLTDELRPSPSLWKASAAPCRGSW